MIQGQITHVPGVFYRFDSGGAGHVRLFGKPGRGILLYHWSQYPAGWAKVRAWHFIGLATLVHVDDERGALEAIGKPGWHLNLASISVKREYHGFSIRFRGADRGYAG